MKIAINTRFLLADKLEGIGWFSHEVLKRWVEAHPEHEFIFIFDRPFDQRFIFADNVKGHYVYPPARHPFLFIWWYEWSVKRLLKKIKPAIFVSPDGFLVIGSKVPTLMVLHDIAWKHFGYHIPYIALKYYQYFVPKFAQKARRIATVSAFSKQDLVDSFGVNADKIDVVYNGSHDNYRPIEASKKRIIQQKYADGQAYFLYLGSIHPRKNIPRLLQAFDQFKSKTKSTMKLLLAGRMAWQTGETGALMERLEHKDSIVFLGYVDDISLASIVASAFALTYVSLFEGFGIPILEAMYCDVPAISSDCSSMPEVVGDAGLLCNPHSVDSIAEKMIELYETPQLREHLIEKGRIHRRHFSWDLTAAKMWDALIKTLT